ncbi:macrolide family glycosyltransferase [Kibdelosporangium persicum]|uniref:macrolide family glycosyltransferase n=1 Tax=Kibdelosporangium persicum TaxID=2698649 RepID=UPI0028AA0F95|nr:macrolide family glycosyltransferase [Kibdelosporangium persicum]
MHIAFCSVPFPGHVSPTLAVVTELVARGHRVSYAVTTDFGEQVKAVGAELVPVESVMRTAEATEQIADMLDSDQYKDDDYVSALRMLTHEARRVLPVLEETFSGDVPDVVVHDSLSWAGRLFAARRRIPALQSMGTLAANEHWNPAGNYEQYSFSGPVFRDVLGEMAQLLDGTGLDVEQFLLDEGVRTIAYHPRAFQPAGPTFDNVHFVGPCVPPPDGTWLPPLDSRPLALIGLGSSFQEGSAFARTCVDAFAEMDWHAVIALGNRELTGHIPPNVQVHRYVPYEDVLPHAQVLIGHPGVITMMAGLRHGVPLLPVPQTAEQYPNAAQVTELGLGLHLRPEDVTVTALRETVAKISSDAGIQANLRWMRREIQASGGARAAAGIIEESALG